jgi:hypothetical protein
MRVLIRSSSDEKLFLADKTQWVARRDDALDFVSSVMALDVATRMGLQCVEIVLDFGDRDTDIILDVPEHAQRTRKSF